MSTEYNAIEGNTSNLGNADERREPAYQVGNGGIEVTGSKVTRRDAPVVNTEDPSQARSAGVLGTLRTEGNGMVVGRPPKGTDTVVVEGGYRTNLNNAVHLGYLKLTPNGYEEVAKQAQLQDPRDKAAQKPAEAAEEAAPKADEHSVSLDADSKEALTELTSKVQPSNLIRGVDSVILNDGEVAPQVLESIASQMQIEPDQAQAVIDTVVAGYSEKVMEVVDDLGIDGEALFNYAQSNPEAQGKWIESLRDVALKGSTASVKDFAQEFITVADRFAQSEVTEALTKAGYEYRIENGGIKVKIGKTFVSWDVAVKQGVITGSWS